MSDRDRIYTELLQAGFVVLRQAIESGDSDWLSAEVEMLHNVPSLIGDQNPERHAYFWTQERDQYVQWVASSGSHAAESRMRTYYEPIWSELSAHIPVACET